MTVSSKPPSPVPSVLFEKCRSDYVTPVSQGLQDFLLVSGQRGSLRPFELSPTCPSGPGGAGGADGTGLEGVRGEMDFSHPALGVRGGALGGHVLPVGRESEGPQNGDEDLGQEMYTAVTRPMPRHPSRTAPPS